MEPPLGEEMAENEEGESLPWWPSGDRGRTASRSGLTRDRIINAGVELIRNEGFQALTMRRIAECLNSGVMSLYWYIANRDELVAVVVDELLRGVPTPSPDLPWRQQVFEVCRAFVSILEPHRLALAALPSGIAPGPHRLRMTNDIYGALGSAGFGGDDLAQGVDAIAALTIGLLFSEPDDDASPDDSESADESRPAPSRVRDIDFGTLHQGRYPHLVAAGARQPGGDTLGYALDTLLDGLEVRLRRSQQDN